MNRFDLPWRFLTKWAFWLPIYSLAVAAIAVWVTGHLWPDLSDEKTTPTAVFRNVALIVGALVALPFAYWRAQTADKQVDVATRQVIVAERQADVASQQADIAKRQFEANRKEQARGRLQRALDMLNLPGIGNSPARANALHELRYLVRDDPDFGIEAIEAVTSFMVKMPVDEEHDLGELTLARMSAEYIASKIEESGKIEAESCRRIRVDVDHAIQAVMDKFDAAGIDSRSPPAR